jgi:hypothetical protein
MPETRTLILPGVLSTIFRFKLELLALTLFAALGSQGCGEQLRTEN